MKKMRRERCYVAKNRKDIHAEDLASLNYYQINELLAKKGNYIQFIENPTEEQCRIAVRQNGYAIRHIKNQTPELIDIAITQFPLSLQYIQNPTDEHITKSFSKDAHAIQFIKNPTYEQKVDAVTRKGATIQYIDNPDYELINIAMENQPMALGVLCKKLTSEQLKYWIRRVAKENPKALKTIINSVHADVQKFILALSGYALRYVNKQTEELCITAVTNNPMAIQFVEIQTPSIQKVVIDSRNSAAIELLDIKDDKVTEHLIEKKPHAFHIVEAPSPTLIKKYNQEVLSKDRKARKEYVATGCIPSDEIAEKNKYEKILDKVETSKGYIIHILDNSFPLYKVINILCSLIEPTHADIATGYLFESGLGMLKPTFKILSEKGVTANLTIGSLQHYNTSVQTSDYVQDMDLNTAKLVNKYIKSNLIFLRTYEKNFYHGKYYCFKGKHISFTIIGSSNVSASGLSNHRELNTIYIYHNSQDIITAASEWYVGFLSECSKIALLDEKCFAQSFSKSSTYELSKYDVQARIDALSDKNQQARLNMWLSKNPTKIYKLDDSHTVAFSSYIVVVYKQYNVCVLESFKSGNAFYCFNTADFSDIENDIKTKSKIQLFNHPLLLKRGYHIADSFNMMLNVNDLFTR